MPTSKSQGRSPRVGCLIADAFWFWVEAHARPLSMFGFWVTLVSAPFAAAADAPFSPDPPPAAGQWFIEAVGPALTFAPPRIVLDAWQLVVAAGMIVVLLGAYPLIRAKPRNRLAILAFALLVVHVLGILLESATLGYTPTQTVGFAAYFPTMFLEPIVLCVAGILGLRRAQLPKAAAWAWILAPVALLLSQIVFFQFPGGSAPGLTLPWMLASRAVAHRTQPTMEIQAPTGSQANMETAGPRR